jgi:hypothetical protein
MRDCVVAACGHINHVALMDFLTEKTMLDFIRETIDRRQKNRWDKYDFQTQQI